MTKYPDIDSSIEDKIDFFGEITNRPLSSRIGNPPEDLQIDLHIRKKLLIFGDKSEFLKEMLSYFPFTYFQVVGWVCKEACKIYDGSIDKRELFKNAEIVLVADSDKSSAIELLDECGLSEKKIIIPEFRYKEAGYSNKSLFVI